MAEQSDWEFPAAAQPTPEDVGFDLDRALSSVVAVSAHIPEDAFTASILGTERGGNGVVIDESGLILTIGYLITEADRLWLTTADGVAAPAHVVGYDMGTGLGLVQALGRLGVPALEIGSAEQSEIGDSVIIAGEGGRRHALKAHVVSKREFAGYWEYVLDEAIFTSPPHPNWGGAALIGNDGRLQGIGSLFVQQAQGEEVRNDGNMIVPIDLLKPILDDMLKFGRVNEPPQPWLGMYTTEYEDNFVVAGLAETGPAAQAGVRVGDIVLEVSGLPVQSLADLFRKIWAVGPAGSAIPLTIARDGEVHEMVIRSADRSDYLKSPSVH